MTMITIKDLTKYYGNFKALDGVSLNVLPNEVYGFIGRNGAGKTTTINIVLSLLDKQSGDVFFMDKLIDKDNTTYKKNIGYVPDVPQFPSYLTATMFLTFVYEVFKLDDQGKKARIDEVLTLVGLQGNTKKISTYSRGMKQRLAIAQALINRPELLIMDEPTSALDPIGRRDILNIIRKLKSHMTIFYSTHILDDAQKVCDRIGLIEQGKMIMEAPIDVVLSRQTTHTYFLEVNKPNHQLLSMLKTQDYVEDAALYAGGIRYKVSDDTGAQTLLKKVVDQGYEVITYRREAQTLEDIFVEVLNENTH